MTLTGATLALALLPLLPPGETAPNPTQGQETPARPGIALAQREAGEVKARLWVVIPEQPAAPGLAQTRWELVVEGPPGIEIDGPRLEDALAGWRRTRESSSWSSNGRARIEVTWTLVQTKPGVMPLPGVTLRVRPRRGAGWVDLAWHDVLQSPRDVPPPVALPPLPPPRWPRALAAVGALLAAGAAGLAGAWGWRRWRSARERPLAPDVRALRALLPPQLPGEDRPIERFAHIAAVVRDLLESELGAPATRQTTDELVSALAGAGQPESVCRLTCEVLERCDRVKFASGMTPSATDEEALDRARMLIASLRQLREGGQAGQKSPPGETG